MHQAVFSSGSVSAQTKPGHPVPAVSPSLSYFSRWSQLGSHPEMEAGGEGVSADCCLSWGSSPWEGGQAFLGSCSAWVFTPWGGHRPLGKARSALAVILWLGQPNGLGMTAWEPQLLGSQNLYGLLCGPLGKSQCFHK